ncbi:MAG: hypothetical protein WC916_03800 [Candidatus Woesearchaeota archaeon]
MSDTLDTISDAIVIPVVAAMMMWGVAGFSELTNYIKNSDWYITYRKTPDIKKTTEYIQYMPSQLFFEKEFPFPYGASRLIEGYDYDKNGTLDYARECPIVPRINWGLWRMINTKEELFKHMQEEYANYYNKTLK